MQEEEDSEEEESEDGAIFPMLGQELVTVSATVGSGEEGVQDGTAAAATLGCIEGMLRLADGRVLMADGHECIRLLSADLQEVSTTTGGDAEMEQGPGSYSNGPVTMGYRDGVAAQAKFFGLAGLVQLPDGRVLVSESSNVRLLSADLLEVSTVAGYDADPAQPLGDHNGYQDGAPAQARFSGPGGLALLPGGCVLVADRWNHRIRLLSANLQHVSTVAGDGEKGHRDGAAVQARFCCPSDLALLPDGRVLVVDNHHIRMLSADLQQVSTVAGDGRRGHHDGLATQARFDSPCNLKLLPGGRVLVSDGDVLTSCRIRVLSADLQDVSTLAIDCVDTTPMCTWPMCFELLPDGRVLVGGKYCICVLEGLVPVLGQKPAAKPPKKSSKRALSAGAAAGAPGPALKQVRPDAWS